MQTRRKSLNLGDLGVIAPKRARQTSHPSPRLYACIEEERTVVEGDEPPVKKAKRSHASDSDSAPRGLMSPPRSTSIRIKEERAKRITELSPPPSPVAENGNKIDTEGINDDIVVGTLRQLEKTGNRPHLVKELAAVLATSLHIVEKSANATALISSRLTAYLNRPWPAISPCPLAKDLSPAHPRRLYFYLTTSPRQPIPEIAEPVHIAANRIFSPSLSSVSAIDEDDRYSRNRQAISPSPEVDLSSPELDEEPHGDTPPTPGASFGSSNSVSRNHRPAYHPHRRASPPLERDERDFKQTASVVLLEQASRRSSQQQQQQQQQQHDMDMDAVAGAERDDYAGGSISMSIEHEDAETFALRKTSEDAAMLFGSTSTEHLHLLLPPTVSSESGKQLDFTSSPLLQPLDARIDEARPKSVSPMKIDGHDGSDSGSEDSAIFLPDAAIVVVDYAAEPFSLDMDDLQSPENIDPAELENLFDAY